MMPKATNMDEAMDTKAEAAEAVTISGAEEISVDSMDAVPARMVIERLFVITSL